MRRTRKKNKNKEIDQEKSHFRFRFTHLPPLPPKRSKLEKISQGNPPPLCHIFLFHIQNSLISYKSIKFLESRRYMCKISPRQPPLPPPSFLSLTNFGIFVPTRRKNNLLFFSLLELEVGGWVEGGVEYSFRQGWKLLDRPDARCGRERGGGQRQRLARCAIRSTAPFDLKCVDWTAVFGHLVRRPGKYACVLWRES